MYPTHFLYRATTGKRVEVGDLTCLLCGCSCGTDCVLALQVLRATFTNHGMARCSASDMVCPACNHYFNYRWLPEGFKKPAEYRLLSMRVFADRMEPWPRLAMRGDLETMLREGCPECLLIVSLSKKKHLLPLSPVNAAGRVFSIRVEEETVELSSGAWFRAAYAFDSLVALGMPKGAILAGNYHHVALRKTSLAEVLRWDAVLAPWRPSAFLTLLSYVTVTEEKSNAGDNVAAG